jgi:hypothetical protein
MIDMGFAAPESESRGALSSGLESGGLELSGPEKDRVASWSGAVGKVVVIGF